MYRGSAYSSGAGVHTLDLVWIRVALCLVFCVQYMFVHGVFFSFYSSYVGFL